MDHAIHLESCIGCAILLQSNISHRTKYRRLTRTGFRTRLPFGEFVAESGATLAPGVAERKTSASSEYRNRSGYQPSND